MKLFLTLLPFLEGAGGQGVTRICDDFSSTNPPRHALDALRGISLGLVSEADVDEAEMLERFQRLVEAHLGRSFVAGERIIVAAMARPQDRPARLRIMFQRTDGRLERRSWRYDLRLDSSGRQVVALGGKATRVSMAQVLFAKFWNRW